MVNWGIKLTGKQPATTEIPRWVQQQQRSLRGGWQMPSCGHPRCGIYWNDYPICHHESNCCCLCWMCSAWVGSEHDFLRAQQQKCCRRRPTTQHIPAEHRVAHRKQDQRHRAASLCEQGSHHRPTAWAHFGGGYGGRMFPPHFYRGVIIYHFPPLFSPKVSIWRGFKTNCDVCHVLCEEFFMLHVTHSHVDVEAEFGVVSLILIFL